MQTQTKEDLVSTMNETLQQAQKDIRALKDDISMRNSEINAFVSMVQSTCKQLQERTWVSGLPVRVANAPLPELDWNSTHEEASAMIRLGGEALLSAIAQSHSELASLVDIIGGANEMLPKETTFFLERSSTPDMISKVESLLHTSARISEEAFEARGENAHEKFSRPMSPARKRSSRASSVNSALEGMI